MGTEGEDRVTSTGTCRDGPVWGSDLVRSR